MRSAGWVAAPSGRTPGGVVGHQLHLPSSWTAAGRSTGRTMSASSAAAIAIPTPNWRTLIMSLNANGTAAAIITAAAPVATAAVRRRPCASAARASPDSTKCSRVRASSSTS